LKRAFGLFLGYFTVLSTLALLFFFLVLPVGVIIKKAFITPDGFTLDYFFLLFSNELQLHAIKNSLLIALAATFLCTLLSYPLALISTRLKFPGKALLSGLLLVPMVMPPFVAAIGFMRFFSRRGSINMMLEDMGLISAPIDWLSEDNKFWVVVVLIVLHLYPIMYLNLTAALANIDPSLEEMCETLGVPKWRRFKDIIMPLAIPGFFAGAIIVFIWAMTDLGTPLLVGYHEVMPVSIFNMVTDTSENPVGFALVVFVIMLTVGFFLLSRFFLGDKRYNMMAKGHVTSLEQPAKWWQLIWIYPFLLTVISAALFPHFSVLITSLSAEWSMTILPAEYTTEYYSRVFATDLPMIGIKNSMLLASASTFLNIVLGLLLAYIITRKLIPFAKTLDSLVMIPLALPGIVLAFGYVVTYTDTFLDPLMNPIPLLIIAYAIRRLPFMVRSASAGLQQTSVSLEEASELFGASKWHTMRKIIIPLVFANLIAGALLCFAYAVLDVSDSLILAMKDQYYPLTKAIYVLFLEQGEGEFIASALGMIGMAILTVCILGSSLILGKKMGQLFRS
jgi:iron(III) transport system permease protein